MSYLERPHLWLPPTQSSPVQELTALLCPTPEPVKTLDDYLYLLADKVVWLIQQEETLEDAYLLIHQVLSQGVFVILQTPDPNDSVTQWAWSVTLYNTPLQECLMNLQVLDMDPTTTVLDFPLQLQSTTPEIREQTEFLTLEAWLGSMHYHCHRE